MARTKVRETVLYFAYGSNLNIDQMLRRCPHARPITRLLLKHYKMVFQRYATIIPAPGRSVRGALYELTMTDVARLDTFEGLASGSYRRVWMTFRIDDKVIKMMTYVKCRPRKYRELPTLEYYRRVEKGYRDWRWSTKHLKTSLRESEPQATRTVTTRRYAEDNTFWREPVKDLATLVKEWTDYEPQVR